MVLSIYLSISYSVEARIFYFIFRNPSTFKELSTFSQFALLPLPTKPFQSHFSGEEVLHQPFFALFFLADELFGKLDGLVPSAEHFGNALLLGKRGKRDLYI